MFVLLLAVTMSGLPSALKSALADHHGAEAAYGWAALKVTAACAPGASAARAIPAAVAAAPSSRFGPIGAILRDEGPVSQWHLRGPSPAAQAARRGSGGTRAGASAGRAPDDALAGALRGGRARVGDHVTAVEERAVEAGAARDAVDLAVAGAEAVVAEAAVERVAHLVVPGLDVAGTTGAQEVVPVAAVEHVDPEACAQHVVAAATVLAVVAVAADDHVTALLAEDRVVAVAAVHAVAGVAAADRVVALAAEEAVERGAVADEVRIAADVVIALPAANDVVSGPPD